MMKKSPIIVYWVVNNIKESVPCFHLFTAVQIVWHTGKLLSLSTAHSTISASDES